MITFTTNIWILLALLPWHTEISQITLVFWKEREKNFFEASAVIKTLELKWRGCWNNTELSVLRCRALELRGIKKQTAMANFKEEA